MSISSNRCDTCSKHHRRCNRRKPSCDVCLLKNLPCTYNNKYHYGKSLLELDANITKFKLPSYQLNNRKKDKNFKLKDNEVKRMVLNPTILRLPEKFNYESTPLGLIHKIPRRYLLDNLMTATQYPSLFKMSSGLKLFLKLTKRLKTLIPKKSIKIKMKVLKISKPFFSKEFLSNIIWHFFRFHNHVFPLINEEGFNFFERTQPLRLAILLSGLIWMKNIPGKEDIISYLSNELKHKLYYLHRIKPSLEILQTLLILISNCRNLPWVFEHLLGKMDYCYRMQTVLGLHLKVKGLNRRVFKERIMTLSCVNIFKLINTLLVNSDMIYFMEYYPVCFDNEDGLKFIIDDNFLNEKMKNYKSTSYLASFYNKISQIMFSIRLLKQDYLQNIHPSNILHQRSISLLKIIHQLQTHCLQFIANLKINSQELNYYYRYILFTLSYLRFFIYTFYFYQPLNNKLTESNQVEINQELIFKALNECRAVLHHGISLPHSFLIIYGVAAISHCTVFILYYKQLSILNFETSLELIKSYLKSIESDSLSTLVKLNLQLIEVVEKYISQKD